MNELLQNLAAMTAIFSFVCVVFGYVVIRPLNLSISRLNDVVTRLSDALNRSIQERHQIEIRLTKVEESVKSAHHRIDKLEETSPISSGDVYIKT